MSLRDPRLRAPWAGRDRASTGPAREAVLVVCTGNICRSAYAELVLQTRLDELAPGRLEVGSAGSRPNQALTVPEPILALVDDAGREHLGRHRPAQLTRPMVDDADLVLAASQEHRAAALRECPGAMGRTFTVLELAEVIQRLDERTGGAWIVPGAGVRAFAAEASRQRGLARAAGGALDVPDPFGGPEAGYRGMAAVLDPALERIAAALAVAATPAS